MLHRLESQRYLRQDMGLMLHASRSKPRQSVQSIIFNILNSFFAHIPHFVYPGSGLQSNHSTLVIHITQVRHRCQH